ncbi:flotillin-like FloA family protein, partial [Candidatus Poribacteria bacterium]|nr:flotillin-like FloA family protein [Candidatus Poribacteria bacterium]
MLEQLGSLVAIPAIIVIVFFVILLWFVPVGLWIAASFSGVKVRIFGDLVGMRLRGVSPQVIVNAQISAVKAGLMLQITDLGAHLLARG